MNVPNIAEELARNATFLGEAVPVAPDKAGERLVVVLGLAYLASLGLVGLFHPLALVALTISAGASVVAFACYWYDKNCAEAGRRRVAESTLHAWAFVGGWPGAAVAQGLFRHKTRKASFQIVFRLIVFLNLLATGGALFFTYPFQF